MGLWTIIIDDASGNALAYKVRAQNAWAARAFALSVYKAHHGAGQVDFIMEGEVVFHANYEGHRPINTLDLGTASFGDDA